MSMDTKPELPAAAKPEQPDLVLISFKEFLELSPPSRMRDVSDAVEAAERGRWAIATPELLLYCEGDRCNGERYFRFDSGTTEVFGNKTSLSTFLTYLCSNCQQNMQHSVFMLNASLRPIKSVINLVNSRFSDQGLPRAFFGCLGRTRNYF